LTAYRTVAAGWHKVHLRLLLALLLPGLLIAPKAVAHKLKVFATAEGAQIQGSAYFAGGAAASGARIEVRDTQGRVLATLSPDPQGGFSYTAKAPVDHVLVALGADGHQAEWTVRAAELAGGFPASVTVPPVEEKAAAKSDAAPPMPMTQRAGPIQLDPASLSAIEVLIARQIRPLREELHEAEDRARLHDILGGVGTIFGITGLALWWDSRRRRARPGDHG
jgi:nickel transport protein